TPTADCDGDPGAAGTVCFTLAASTRQVAGNSPAGIAAGNIGTGIMCGAPIPEDGDPTDYKVAGLSVQNVSGFGISVPFHLTNCVHFYATDVLIDSVRKIKDNSSGCGLVDADTKKAYFTNVTCGKTGHGFGITVNAPEDDSEIGAVVLTNTAMDIEVDQGLVSSKGFGSTHNVLIANAAEGVQLCGDYTTAQVIYQGAAAQAVTDTSCAITGTQSGASWWGGHFEPGGYAPTLGADC